MASDRRKLTHEERIIWAKVARTVTPLAGHQPAAEPEEDWFLDPDGLPGEAATHKKGHPQLRLEPESDSDAGTARLRPPEPKVTGIDKPVRRKLAKGRLPVDGRIDLHGLTQSEAHNLLFGFLARAHERGLRHVLVITGKGSSPGSEGVLRRAVPQWLSKPEFRFLVSGVDAASRGHGGEGALYIRLRKASDRRQ